MSYPLVMIPLAVVLAVVLFGMLTRLARGLWREQVRAASAQIVELQAARLPRSHRRPKFGRAA